MLQPGHSSNVTNGCLSRRHIRNVGHIRAKIPRGEPAAHHTGQGGCCESASCNRGLENHRNPRNRMAFLPCQRPTPPGRAIDATARGIENPRLVPSAKPVLASASTYTMSHSLMMDPSAQVISTRSDPPTPVSRRIVITAGEGEGVGHPFYCQRAVF